LQNERKKLVPSPVDRQFRHYFDCIAKLMESQLLTACKKSLRDFVDYVVHGKVNARIFSLRSTRNRFQTGKRVSLDRLCRRALLEHSDTPDHPSPHAPPQLSIPLGAS
jgi:hypothetical protein